MTEFIFAFGFFVVIIAAMAIGYIIQRKTISGSCGGLASVGIEKVCGCEKPCEKRLERERKAKEAELAEQRAQLQMQEKGELINIKMTD